MIINEKSSNLISDKINNLISDKINNLVCDKINNLISDKINFEGNTLEENRYGNDNDTKDFSKTRRARQG